MSTSRPKTRAQAKAAQASKGRRVATGSSGASASGSPRSRPVLLVRHRLLRGLRDDRHPQPNDLAEAQASIIYYADGKTEMDRITARATASRCRCRRCPRPCSRRTCAPPRTATSTTTPASRPTGIARAVWVDALQRRADPGWLHDHPAVRQELLPDPGPDADPQGARRSSSRSRSTSRSPRTRSSRTTSTPSTTAAAPTASRPRPRRTSARTSPSSPRPRGRCSPRSSAGPCLLRPRAWAPSRRRTREARVDLRPRRHGRRGLADARPSAPRRSSPRSSPTRPRRPRAARTATSSTRCRRSCTPSSG